MDAVRIDQNGYIIETLTGYEGEITADIITEPVPVGLQKPRWYDNAWMEAIPTFALRVDAEGYFLSDEPFIPFHLIDSLGLIAQRPPAGLHTPRWDGSQWIEGKAKGDLDALIVIQKSHQIDDLRNQKIAMGLSYTFPDGLIGTIQIRNTIDQMNLTGLGTAALGRTNKGRTDSFNFIDAENVKHALTPDGMIDMGLTVQEFVSNLTETARFKKDELKDSTDPANYDVEAGW